MQLKFSKYQGTGNDFILLDNRDKRFTPTPEIISRLANRKFGVGADGVMLIEKHPSADFRMIYFNSDGSQSLCGNGSRCAIAFANSLGMLKHQTYFETTDGFHKGEILNDLTVSFEILDVEEVHQVSTNEYFVNTGSPHHIIVVDDINKIDLLKDGSSIRYSDVYKPDGTNVNFVDLQKGHVQVRTYERGVEDETLSCGTGVTAVALTVASKLGYKSPVKIRTKGGELQVSFSMEKGKFRNIYLSGPAKKVFDGVIDI